ncbi:MAG: hypothetical protein ONB13_04580 [candidate division KSB1 bacterium]|nr:hypothetical protein [candidate division KSB1 bacterium]MDZ7334052.1 hypothetical protein [candidate division KSB1 bacterium]MDZ7356876.1 hypothetical protein [candidate division KSB1 bacterium]MDZ7375877.1 hypothetical protein [candidate division KSB1 bacterium]MDZ7399540.1 hypothetical protein [candidate division KSB1 bacterium]
MRVQHQILNFLIVFGFMFSGCAKRIQFSYDEIKPNSILKIQTVSGKLWNGLVQTKSSDHLLLKQSRLDDQYVKINRSDIIRITGRQPVYDDLGEVISEWEIQDQRTNKNLALYSIGGLALSFGASFFIGSLVNRSIEDADRGQQLLWSTTAAGTAIGTYLFARLGRDKDRQLAIEKIRDQRFAAAKGKYEERRKKHELIRQQLEKEKAEQERQARELKLLQEQIKSKKEKEN